MRLINREQEAAFLPHGRTVEDAALAFHEGLDSAPHWRLVPGNNPRKTFDAPELRELALNIHALTRWQGDEVVGSGILLPLLVRRRGEALEIVAGERRYRAVAMLIEGIEDGDQHLFLPADYPVPVRVLALGDAEALEVGIIENELRASVSELEQADAYATLLQMGRSREALRRTFGITEDMLKRRLLLTRLDPFARRALEEGEITAGHAGEIAAAGALASTLLERARRGAKARELRTLRLSAHVHPDCALFGPGLAVEGGGAAARFADPEAAMERQLGEIARLGALHEMQGGEARFALSHTPGVVPREYEPGGRLQLALMNPHGGEVVIHPGLRLRAARVRDRERERPRYGESTLRAGQRARATGLMEGLLARPQLALANLAVQLLLTYGGAARFEGGIPAEWRALSPEVVAAAARACEASGGLLHTPQPGVLALTPGRGGGEALMKALCGWSVEALGELLALLSCTAAGRWAAPQDRTSPYLRALAGLADADARAAAHFDLADPAFLGGMSREVLETELRRIPGKDAPLIVPDTKPADLAEIAADRAETLRARGWMPEFVRFSHCE